MKYIYKTLFVLLLCSVVQLSAQQTPAPVQTETTTITGATVHIGNGEVVENASIVLQNGLITELGKQEEIESKGRVIDASGKQVYPGFILANSTLGLGEVDAVRATRDYDELGTFLPHVRSLIAYNAESRVIESLRPNGILLAQATPRGGRISGTSSVVQCDAWNWEDAAVRVDDGIHLNWPSTYHNKYVSFGNVQISGANEKYGQQIYELKDFLLKARAYQENSAKEKRNLVYEAMKPLFEGKSTLYIHANREKEILDALELSIEMNIEQMVLVGAQESYKTMEAIKKHNIPVILARVHSLPLQADDDYDQPYKSAAVLVKNGILVALENSGSMERMNGRNLPFYAGTVSSYGLSDEEALQLITLNPAKILGIEDRYGSLEIGKSATLFISDGNALEMKSNQLSHAFIDGRAISLESHQTELWKRYMKKYEASSE